MRAELPQAQERASYEKFQPPKRVLRIWRIGLMGSGSTRENVLLVLGALHRALNAESFSGGSGVEAAQAIYDSI